MQVTRGDMVAFRFAPAHVWLDRLLALLIMSMLAYAAFTTWPHVAPYSPNVWLDSTLWVWDHSWVLFGSLLGVTPLLLLLASTLPACNSPDNQVLAMWLSRPMIRVRLFVWPLAVLCIIGAILYLHLILPILDHTGSGWPGVLWNCRRWCPDVYEYCQPMAQTQRDPTLVAGEAFAWYQSNVYGTPTVAISASVAVDNSAFTIAVDGHVVTAPLFDAADGVHFLLGDRGSIGYGLTVSYAHVPVLLPLEEFWDRSVDSPLIGVIAGVHRAVQQALLIRFPASLVSTLGCSRDGKAAAWAAALAAQAGQPFSNVYLESPGTLIASVLEVGQCGETMHAMAQRRGEWIHSDVAHLGNAAYWPYDVGEALAVMCGKTNVAIGYSPHDLWNNIAGTERTVDTLRARGCAVEVTKRARAHCGHVRFYKS